MDLNDFFFVLGWPLAMSVVMVAMLSYLGFHVLERGVIFVDLALAQISALGVAVAVLVGIPLEVESGIPWGSYAMSMGFTVFGAMFFSLTRFKNLKIPHEAFIGIAFGIAAGATQLVRSLASLIGRGNPEDLEQLDYLFEGRLQYVFRWQEVATVAVIYAGVGIVHYFLRDRFFTITLRLKDAYTRGWNIKLWDFWFYVLFGLVISIAVRVIGVLLVFTYLVVTAIIGALFVKKTSTRLLVSFSVGVLLSVVGMVASFVIQPVQGENLPTVPTLICVFGLGLLLAGSLRWVWSQALAKTETRDGSNGS